MGTDSKKRGYRRKSLEGVKQQRMAFNAAAEAALTDLRFHKRVMREDLPPLPAGTAIGFLDVYYYQPACQGSPSLQRVSVPAKVIGFNDHRQTYLLQVTDDAGRFKNGHREQISPYNLQRLHPQRGITKAPSLRAG